MLKPGLITTDTIYLLYIAVLLSYKGTSDAVYLINRWVLLLLAHAFLCETISH